MTYFFLLVCVRCICCWVVGWWWWWCLLNTNHDVLFIYFIVDRIFCYINKYIHLHIHIIIFFLFLFAIFIFIFRWFAKWAMYLECRNTFWVYILYAYTRTKQTSNTWLRRIHSFFSLTHSIFLSVSLFNSMMGQRLQFCSL